MLKDLLNQQMKNMWSVVLEAILPVINGILFTAVCIHGQQYATPTGNNLRLFFSVISVLNVLEYNLIFCFGETKKKLLNVRI